MTKICVNCKSWRYYAGDKAYSEMTPGYDLQTFCYQSHWRLSTRETTQDEYRAFLLMAKTCDDYDPITEDIK